MKTRNIIAIALLCALLLAGCGSKSSDAVTPTQAPATAAPEPTAVPTATPETTPAPTATPEATAAPTEAPTATPAPTAVPTATPSPAPTATPTPAPEKPFVRKHPVDAAVNEGGSCVFEADYINAIWAVWHFVSPDGKTDLPYDKIGTVFPNMQVKNGMYSKMELSNIPLAANGWKVYCRYTNTAGDSDSGMALLTVKSGAAPVSYPVAGSYVDNIAGRGRMEITGSSALCNVSVTWANDAWTNNTWSFSGFFDDSGVMRYTNATMVTTTYDANGSGSSETKFTNGSGTLTYSTAADDLTWKDDHGTSGTFVRSVTPTPAPVVNQWIETTDLEAAVRNAGIEFHPPIPEALPEGLSLDLYRSKSGIVEARYSSGTMLIRKSNTLSGSDLSGDMNNYSQTWEHAFKNVGSVRCRGNGDTVNEATFSAGGYNYSITYHSGQEGLGLTLDQINSIIQGM